jgi:hypothetical protein
MPFAVPMMWWELTDHFTDCYFGMVPPIHKGITKMKKMIIEIPKYTIDSSSSDAL